MDIDFKANVIFIDDKLLKDKIMYTLTTEVTNPVQQSLLSSIPQGFFKIMKKN